MPVTSRSRSTARPPITRPSASMAWPASVINGMVKLSPLTRSASVARSIACALSGSSQVPNASTRCFAAALVISAVSPMMSGSLSAAAHDTSTCGSERSIALKRSLSARNVPTSSRSAVSVAAARILVRTSMTAVVTPNRMTPRMRASGDQLMAVERGGGLARTSEHREERRNSRRNKILGARGGAEAAGRRSRRCPPARILSGMSRLPLRRRWPPAYLTPTNRLGFNPKRSRAGRVQSANGRALARWCCRNVRELGRGARRKRWRRLGGCRRLREERHAPPELSRNGSAFFISSSTLMRAQRC